MVCKIICCSEFPDIPDKAGRKTRRRRRRTKAIAKRYAFHANAIIFNLEKLKRHIRCVDLEESFNKYLYRDCFFKKRYFANES